VIASYILWRVIAKNKRVEGEATFWIGGTEILLKVVAQPIQLICMQCMCLSWKKYLKKYYKCDLPVFEW
jgi:hypothetical protein